jgi:hypothetical protein
MTKWIYEKERKKSAIFDKMNSIQQVYKGVKQRNEQRGNSKQKSERKKEKKASIHVGPNVTCNNNCVNKQKEE